MSHGNRKLTMTKKAVLPASSTAEMSGLPCSKRSRRPNGQWTGAFISLIKLQRMRAAHSHICDTGKKPRARNQAGLATVYLLIQPWLTAGMIATDFLPDVGKCIQFH